MRSTVFRAMILGFLLTFCACGSDDATANSSDVSTSDAGTSDAGTSDAGTSDSSTTDASPDAASSDAANADGADADTSPRTSLRVMTFNVLCSFCVFSDYDPWAERLPHLQAIIAEHNVDLLGLQELTFAWDDKDEVGDMIAKLPGFASLYYISPKDEGPLPAYPDGTIYYRTSRFELVNNGFFWLSPTPDEPFSSGFAAKGSLPRIVAWAALKDLHRGGREVLFLSTHFDNSSPSQDKSAPLFVSRIAELRVSSASAPNALRDLVAVGDFNSAPATTAYKTLVKQQGDNAPLIDSQTLAANIEKIGAPADQQAWQVSEGIDHIFVTKNAAGAAPEVLRWAVDLRRFGANDRFPSDHWPVLADIEMK